MVPRRPAVAVMPAERAAGRAGSAGVPDADVRAAGRRMPLSAVLGLAPRYATPVLMLSAPCCYQPGSARIRGTPRP
jgi:hypothetical protein